MTNLQIKIFGERNTGTKYLERLIQLNLEIALFPGVAPRLILRTFGRGSEIARDLYFSLTYRRNLGWKHAMAPSAEDLKNVDISNILFVAITKNPYSWLLSLYRRPYHSRQKTSSFESFLVSPWKTVGRENYAGAFKNPIEMWNMKNNSYLRLGDFAFSCLIRYEDLLENPAAFINEIAVKFAIPRKRETFANPEESTKEDKNRTFTYYKRYYLEEQWKENLSTDLVKTINSYLDHNLVTKLGYTVLD